MPGVLRKLVQQQRFTMSDAAAVSASKKRRTEDGHARVTDWDSPLVPGILSVGDSIAKAVEEQPFRHWVLHDIFTPSFLTACKKQLAEASFNEKNNDLYQFKQSDSLTVADSGALRQLRETLYSPDFVAWMSTVSGIELDGTIDMSSAVYDDTSYLLCHDDDLSERRIAYILYLVPPTWSASDGGTLDLYSADAAGAPDVIVKSIVPRFNTLAFFEVSHLSFHQVAEVLSGAKGGRMSISGWFHGPPLTRPAPALPPPPTYYAPWTLDDSPSTPPAVPLVLAAAAGDGGGTDSDASSVGPPSPGRVSNLAKLALGPCQGSAYTQLGMYRTPADVWSAWVNPMYVAKAAKVLPQMSAAFNASGVLQLENFLAPHALEAVMAALPTHEWRHVAPANLQHFRRSATSTTAQEHGACAREALQSTLFSAAHSLELFMQSAAFVEFLSAATGQQLVGVTLECRAFGHRDYTMICDAEYQANRRAAKRSTVAERSGAALKASGAAETQHTAEAEAVPYTPSVTLEVTLCLPMVLGTPGAGKCAPDGEGEWPLEAGGFVSYLTSDEEVLTVPVKPNTLSVVAKPPGLYSFVKYVNHKAPGIRFDVLAHFAIDEDED